jgi:hypothetical protein
LGRNGENTHADIEAHLRRIHARCLDIIAEEVQNCSSLADLYGECGNVSPAFRREVHVQSLLFAGLRSSGYFTMAGVDYFHRDPTSWQVDLAIWLPEALRWFYMELKHCEQQGGYPQALSDRDKFVADGPLDERDRLRGL